jgi:hypothetical protein
MPEWIQDSKSFFGGSLIRLAGVADQSTAVFLLDAQEKELLCS